MKSNQDIRTQNKIKDLKCLYKVIQIISDIEKISLEHAKILSKIIKISELMGGRDGVTYDDENKDSIRNKYGDVKRHIKGNNKLAKQRKGGICFEKLYRIHQIYSKNSTFSKDDIIAIKKDLSHLKTKLLVVFKNEEVFVNKHLPDIQVEETKFKNLDENGLENIEQFVDDNFDQLLVALIASEIQEAKTSKVNFGDIYDRHYIARKIIIIAELINDLSDKNYKDFNEVTNHLYTLRSHLIHYYKDMVLEFDTVFHLNAPETFDKFWGILTTIFDKKSFKDKEILEKLESICREVSLVFVSKQKALNKLYDSLCNALKIYKKKQDKDKQEELTRLNNEYDSILKILRNDEKKDYSISSQKLDINELDRVAAKLRKAIKKENQNEVTNSPKTTEEKISFFLSHIDDALKLYNAVIANSSLSDVKKNYIRQYIIEIIGQYLRDLKKEIPEYKNVESLLSNTFNEFTLSAITVRNKGLSHDILGFDIDLFEQIISNNIIPAHEDVASIHTIFRHQGEAPSTIRLNNNIGYAYTRLGLYDKAVERFEEALKIMNDNPEQVDKEKLEEIGITQQNVKVFHLDRYFFGVDSYYFKVSLNLISVLLYKGDYQIAYDRANSLIRKITSVDFAIDKFLDDIAILFNNIATLSYEIQQCEDIDRLFQYALNLAKNKDIKAFVMINQAQSFIYRFQDFSRIEEIATKWDIEGCNPYVKFQIYKQKLEFIMHKKLYNEIDNILLEQETLLQKYEGLLRRDLGDRYLLLKIEVLHTKVAKIFDNPTLEEIERIENETRGLMDNIKPSLRKTKEVAALYVLFSQVYSSISCKGNTVINLEKAEGYFKKAEEYLIKAIDCFSNKRNRLLINAVQYLASLYSNYAMLTLQHQHNAKKIKYLKKALKYQNEFQIDNNITIGNLGIVFYNIAEDLYSIARFSEAAEMYYKAIECLLNVDRSKVEFCECIKVLGMSYEGLGDCDRSDRYFVTAEIYYKMAIIYYKQYLKFIQNDPEEYKAILKYKQNCEHKIHVLKPSSAAVELSFRGREDSKTINNKENIEQKRFTKLL